MARVTAEHVETTKNAVIAVERGTNRALLVLSEFDACAI